MKNSPERPKEGGGLPREMGSWRIACQDLGEEGTLLCGGQHQLSQSQA